MFRFWVAGAAFFSLVVSLSAAEMPGGATANSSSAPTTTDLFGVTLVTPTSNSASRFSGATGLGTAIPLNQTWSTATPRPISFSSSGPPAATNRGLIVNDPTQWTDSRRSMTSYFESSGAAISSPTLTPAASYFAPAKSTLFAAPMGR